LQDIMRIIIFF